jgi:hypothetical protein
LRASESRNRDIPVFRSFTMTVTGSTPRAADPDN